MSKDKEPIKVEFDFKRRAETAKIEADERLYQWLFNHMKEEHGLVLLQPELQNIIRIVEDGITPQPLAAPLTKGGTVTARDGKVKQADTWVTCPVCDGLKEVFVENSFDGGDIVPNLRCHNGKVRKRTVEKELIPNQVIWAMVAIVIACVLALLFKVGIFG